VFVCVFEQENHVYIDNGLSSCLCFSIGHLNEEELEWKKLLALACTALEKVLEDE